MQRVIPLYVEGVTDHFFAPAPLETTLMHDQVVKTGYLNPGQFNLVQLAAQNDSLIQAGRASDTDTLMGDIRVESLLMSIKLANGDERLFEFNPAHAMFLKKGGLLEKTTKMAIDFGGPVYYEDYKALYTFLAEADTATGDFDVNCTAWCVDKDGNTDPSLQASIIGVKLAAYRNVFPV